jgi:hypothetical protein
LRACEQLLDECEGCECPPAVECDDTWKEFITDRKVQTAIVTISIAIIGAVIGGVSGVGK